jgi:hypothetical protein
MWYIYGIPFLRSRISGRSSGRRSGRDSGRGGRRLLTLNLVPKILGTIDETASSVQRIASLADDICDVFNFIPKAVGSRGFGVVFVLCGLLVVKKVEEARFRHRLPLMWLRRGRWLWCRVVVE